MPTHNQYFRENDNLSPRALAQAGPVLQADIGISQVLADHLALQGELVPNPVAGWVLIDTGATRTAIDETVVQNLNLQPVGTTQLSTAHGLRTAGLYPCHFHFVSQALPDAEITRATGVDLSGKVWEIGPSSHYWEGTF